MDVPDRFSAARVVSTLSYQRHSSGACSTGSHLPKTPFVETFPCATYKGMVL